MVAGNVPDLPAIMAGTGQKSFDLAYVLAPNGGSCTPTWDGGRPVGAETAIPGLIGSVREAGGDVVVSFGGFRGTKLGQVCSDARTTADAYQEVIDRYRLRAVDFDIEAPGYDRPEGVANEIGAAQILQRRNPGLRVSITTAGTTAGTGWFGQRILDVAKSIGFAPDSYAIRVDNGFSGASSQIGALEAFHGVLMNTFGWDSATAYAREGFVGVNGRTADGGVFSPGDFQLVLNHALARKMGRYAFFSANRDRPCEPGLDRTACSDIAQNPGDFTRITAAFGTATTPTVPATTSTSTEPPPPPPTTEPPPPPRTTTPAAPPPPRYSAVGGPGCTDPTTGVSPVGYYTDGNTGWMVYSGGYTGAGCDGRYLAVPMSGDRYRDDQNAMLWHFDTSAAGGGTCRVSVYVPDSQDIQRVGGNTSVYSVYDHSSGTQIAGFNIDQVRNRGRWVDAASFPASSYGVTIHLHTRGQDWVGDRPTNAHHAAGPINVTCR